MMDVYRKAGSPRTFPHLLSGLSLPDFSGFHSLFPTIPAYPPKKQMDVQNLVFPDPACFQTGIFRLDIYDPVTLNTMKMGVGITLVIVSGFLPGGLEGCHEFFFLEDPQRIIYRCLGKGGENRHEILVNFTHRGMPLLTCQILKDLDPVMRGSDISGNQNFFNLFHSNIPLKLILFLKKI